MPETVEITIPVDADVAQQLGEQPRREAAGRMLSYILRRQDASSGLLDAMERLSADAARRGLTQERLDEELAAHKAERQSRFPPRST